MKRTFLTLIYLFLGILIINVSLYLTASQVLAGGESHVNFFDREASPLIKKAHQLAVKVDTAISKNKNALLTLNTLPLLEKEKLELRYNKLLKSGAIGVRPREDGRYSDLYIKRKLTTVERKSLVSYLQIIIRALTNLLQQINPSTLNVDPDLRQSNINSQANVGMTQANAIVTNEKEPKEKRNESVKRWLVHGVAVGDFAPAFFTNEAFVPINERGRLEIEIKQADNGFSLGSGVTFFTEHSYAGKHVSLAPGKYGPEQLAVRGIPGGMIKSVQVPPKHSVTFYREPDFQPPQFMTSIDIPDLSAGDMHIASLVVSKSE